MMEEENYSYPSSQSQILSSMVHKQERQTCYAHSIATVIASAERRIEGRTPKDHYDIVSEITVRHGFEGGKVPLVLHEECKKRQLRYRTVERTEEIKDLIRRGHAILGTFYLDGNQWFNLGQFFMREPEGILTKDDLSKSESWSDDSNSGSHAVAIGGYNERGDCWKIKNSWGEESGDNGYWKVSAENGLDFTFYHVYFLIEDLTFIDLQNYICNYGSNYEIEAELRRRAKNVAIGAVGAGLFLFSNYLMKKKKKQ